MEALWSSSASSPRGVSMAISWLAWVGLGADMTVCSFTPLSFPYIQSPLIIQADIRGRRKARKDGCVPVAGVSRLSPPSVLIKGKLEIIVRRGHMDPVDGAAVHEPGQEFAADFRQQRVGDERVNHARAAFQLGA